MLVFESVSLAVADITMAKRTGSQMGKVAAVRISGPRARRHPSSSFLATVATIAATQTPMQTTNGKTVTTFVTAVVADMPCHTVRKYFEN